MGWVNVGPLSGVTGLARKGNGIQGKFGKEAWTNARKSIAVAMVRGDLFKIRSQIFPETVQVQTVLFQVAEQRY
jgi:hypothetical protein